jgi:hypothetical protein
LQLTTIQWLPFVFLFLARYLDARRRSDLLWFGGFYFLQMLTTMYMGAFVSLTVLVYLVIVALAGRARVATCVRPLVAMAVCLAALTPVLLPYLALRRQATFSRSEQENVFFSARPVDLVTPAREQTVYRALSDHVIPTLKRRWDDEGALTLMEHTLFPGLGVLGLAALGAVVWRQGRPVWLTLAVLGPLLSLGPKLGRLPLPYWLLYHGVPGFSGLRAPSRFMVIGLLGMALLAGAGVAWLWQRREHLPRLALLLALIVLAAEQVCLPVRLRQVPLLRRSTACRHGPVAGRRQVARAVSMALVQPPWRWDAARHSTAALAFVRPLLSLRRSSRAPQGARHAIVALAGAGLEPSTQRLWAEQ